MKHLIIPALIILLTAGCGTTSDVEQSPASVESRNGGRIATIESGRVDGRRLPAELSDPKSTLSKRSVYFDYDRFDIKPEFGNLVAAHARFLANNSQFRMLIQGNTDDRGSREYNLALGQKRADAVKKQLVLLGAREDQIEAVSLGKEKPKNIGQNEPSWSENRRADMLYNGEF